MRTKDGTKTGFQNQKKTLSDCMQIKFIQFGSHIFNS